MKRHIAEVEENEKLPGPACAAELFNWAKHAFRMLKQKTGVLERLHALLKGGVQLCSHYSGKGTAESIFHQLETVMRNDQAGPAPSHESGRPRSFQSVFACDHSALARKCLLAIRDDAGAGPGIQHVFGSIEARCAPSMHATLSSLVPADVLSAQDKEEQHAQMRKVMFDNLGATFSEDNTAPCYVRNARCPIWGDVRKSSSKEMRINCSGFSCTDWSSRRMGGLPGFGGKTAPIFHRWVAEMVAFEPDILFWETSPHFPAEYFVQNEEVNSRYQCLALHVSPDELGWPVERKRCFGVWLHRSRIAFHGDLSLREFKSLFCNRKVEISGNVFFAAPDNYVLAHMLKKAASRGHHFREFVSLEELKRKLDVMVSPVTMKRYREYENIFQIRACEGYGRSDVSDVDAKEALDVSTSFICDLEQSHNFAKSGPLVPSIPTHSSLFSFQARRMLAGAEVLGCMGLSGRNSDRQYFKLP